MTGLALRLHPQQEGETHAFSVTQYVNGMIWLLWKVITADIKLQRMNIPEC